MGLDWVESPDGGNALSAIYIARSTAIASRMLAGETMVMSVVDSTFFTLNEVASAIWQAADGVTPLEEIVTRNVCLQFDVARRQAVADAQAFVRELSSHGILHVSHEPIHDSVSAASSAASGAQ